MCTVMRSQSHKGTQQTNLDSVPSETAADFEFEEMLLLPDCLKRILCKEMCCNVQSKIKFKVNL